MIRLRNTDQWIGALVLLALVIFFGAALQAGVLRDFFRSHSTLRVILPDSGVAGLSVGADVQVLGTHAGRVTRIVINPNQQMYAEADIDAQATAFIRRDSQAVIRKQFGVAGAAYLDIARGTGAPLDWRYAVINASTERAPTDNIGALIDEARQKIFPILDDTGRSMRALADVAQRIEHGQGDIGRLMTDETLVRDAEASLSNVRKVSDDLPHIVAGLQRDADELQTLAQSVTSHNEGIPNLLRVVNRILADLQSFSDQLTKTGPRVPGIIRNVENSTANLPALMTQTQDTERDLQFLAEALRKNWLIGGGRGPEPEPRRLPSSEVRP